MVLLLKHNLRTDVLELNSRRGKALPKYIEAKLEDVAIEIEELLKYCEINDSTTNATGIYKWGRAVSSKLGTHYTKEMDLRNKKKYSSIIIGANDPI
jgi:hypothetical protein